MPHSNSSVKIWIGKPAPRYTSYPPATQFKPVSSEETVTPPHLAVLAASKTPVSLYVHIPFCRELCLFCGCHTFITNRDEREENYLNALFREIDLVREKLDRPLSVAHLHFGGGSPSVLTPTQLNSLMRRLRTAFDIPPDAEIAMELDPRTTSPALIKALAEEGINRVSLGIQDINPEVQQAINRIQPFEMVAETVALIRNAGINAISFDLMYGLPHQTLHSLTDTTEQIISLHPTRISLFAYAHVPTIKPHQRALERHGLPDSYDRVAMEQAARKTLENAGFVAIGMDHFALPDDPLATAQLEGRLSRNFQGYTDDPASLMLGLGASAISDVETLMIQNDPNLDAYQTSINNGNLPLRRICPRSFDDRRRETIIRNLMCNFEAIIPPDLSPNREDLAPFIENGIARWDGNKLKIDTTYRMAVRMVATLFDETYNPELLSSKVS